ncbi:hypothetical protein GYMLUDRAFT_63373 [Collybiopsis luxurians FD-317 M1]|uniref:Uncharacterized protein n=1 Tax=Collybiopsis luxurians FD-317 M1 TaxID=944289 RepID=A0A0D0CGK3_9AGAR|nr:hypothetical protein GYMLUDRAFT_63373 [Collybiopsis luxurians FD-317 M1]
MFHILVMHPNADEPLRQPVRVDLAPGLPVPAGCSAWLVSLNKVLKGSVYLSKNAKTGLLAMLQSMEDHSVSSIILLCIFRELPFTLPVCTDLSACTRSLSTRYWTSHAIALALDSSGKLQSVNSNDKLLIWSWFCQYVDLLPELLSLLITHD